MVSRGPGRDLADGQRSPRALSVKTEKQCTSMASGLRPFCCKFAIGAQSGSEEANAFVTTARLSVVPGEMDRGINLRRCVVDRNLNNRIVLLELYASRHCLFGA